MEKIKIIENDFEQKCTGCGACKNACPVGAITMVEGYNTLMYPQIDENKCIKCGKCKRVCVVNSLQKSNPLPQTMFAFRANDEIRKNCSSGGVFPVLARHIISHGGYVCGSAFDDNMKLKTIIVSKLDDLDRLYNSKYLQSDVGFVYKEIEKLLKNKKTVLFCGTPCQVVALKNVLGVDYENLFVLDILCHGVPSQKIFDLYLKDISKGKKVKDVKFRNKIFGWSAEHSWIEFEDNSVYTKTRFEGDPWVKAFLENYDLRDCCESCEFSELPRVGDLTIGDFWGIQKVDNSQNDNKGTSIVLCNTKKGKKLLDILKSSGQTKDYAFDKSLPNRFNKIFPHNKQKHRFFKLLNHHSFSESVEYVKNKKYDVGVVCNYLAINFGGGLTQYALFNVIEDLGYSALMIERPLDSPEKADIEILNEIYIKNPFYQCSKIYNTKFDMRELNDICDSFVVGSDVLFRNSLWKKMGKISTLDFADNTKRKIAYAGSYGFDFMEGTASENAEMSYFMKKFDAFSVREESGVKLFKDNFGVNATHVLDPVFLCDKSHYDNFIENSNVDVSTKYICSYLLDPTLDKIDILNYAKNSKNENFILFSEYFDNPQLKNFKEKNPNIEIQTLKSEDRLNYIKNCDFMIADSFHGICFAIIYNKPFIAIVNKARGATRFYSLLKMFGLEDRMVYTFEDVKNNPKLLEPIDYTKVNSILAKEKERCLLWLKNALEKKKDNTYDTYDILIKELQQKNVELEKQIQKQASILSRIFNLDYIFETDINKYLEKINNQKENLAIIISAKDTPGLAITDTVLNNLLKLGIATNLKNKHWCGYSAIIYKGLTVAEKCEYESMVSCEFSINDLNIETTSSPLHQGNSSSIKINNVEYSTNLRGLNFVIFDLNKNIVVDQVAFDTHEYRLLSTRK